MNKEIERLEKRIHNLEIYLVGVLALVDDLLPPGYQKSVNAIGDDWGNGSSKLGALRGVEFKE